MSVSVSSSAVINPALWYGMLMMKKAMTWGKMLYRIFLYSLLNLAVNLRLF